jgi:hypothetical protein
MSHTSSSFCFSCFWDRVSLYALACLDSDIPIIHPTVATLTGRTTMSKFFPLRWGLPNFLLGLVWNSHLPYLSLSCCWDGRCVPLHPGIDWDGVLGTFCPSWLQTAILPISASQIVRITGVSHLYLSQVLALLFLVMKQSATMLTWRGEGRLLS